MGQVWGVGTEDVTGWVVSVGAGRQVSLPVPVQAIHRDDRDVLEAKLRWCSLLPTEEALDHHHALELHPPQVFPSRPKGYMVSYVPTCTVSTQKHPRVVHVWGQVRIGLLTLKPFQRFVGVIICHREFELRCSPAKAQQFIAFIS